MKNKIILLFILICNFIFLDAQTYAPSDLEGIYVGYMRKGDSQFKKIVAMRLYPDNTVLIMQLTPEPSNMKEFEKVLNKNNTKTPYSKSVFKIENDNLSFVASMDEAQNFFKGKITKAGDDVMLSFKATDIRSKEVQTYMCNRKWKWQPEVIVKKDEKVIVKKDEKIIDNTKKTDDKLVVKKDEKVIDNTKKTDDKQKIVATPTVTNTNPVEIEKTPEKEIPVLAANKNKAGIQLYESGDYESAVENFKMALKNSGDTNSVFAAILQNNIGAAQENNGNFSAAVKSYRKASELYKKNGEQNKSLEMLNAAANVYHNSHESVKENEILSELIKEEEKETDKTELSASYNNMANNFFNEKNYVKAAEYVNKAIEIDKAQNNSQGLAVGYNNLGNILFGQDQLESSIAVYLESVKFKKEISNKKSESLTLHNLGNVYLKKGNTDSAQYYYETSLGIAQKENYSDVVQADYLGLAHLISKKNNCVPVLDYYKLYTALRFAVDQNEQLIQLSEQREKYSQRNKSQLLSEVQELERDKKASMQMISTLEDNLRRKERLAKLQKASDELQIQNLNQDKSLLAKEKQLTDEANSKKTIFLLGVSVAALLSLGLFFMAWRSSVKNKKARIEISSQKQKIEEQHKILEVAHTEIEDSINYAQRLQFAILPPVKLVKQHLKESFILYKPKHVVAGDFYWMETTGNNILLAAADCTGHGVPGALVSVICNNALYRAVRENKLSLPGKILDRTREIVIEEFEKSESEVKDGMDISLCSYNTVTRQLLWAGANNPLWIIRKNSKEVEERKATKQPVGKTSNPKEFTTHTIEMNAGDSIYIFSDGFSDQFGGDNGKKFMSANFKKLLLSVQHLNLEQQSQTINEIFEKWRGKNEQVDDVCVIGVRV